MLGLKEGVSNIGLESGSMIWMVFTCCIWSASTEVKGGLAGKMNAVAAAARGRNTKDCQNSTLKVDKGKTTEV